MKKMSKFKEKMPPSKRINKRGGKQVAGRKYAEAVEDEEDAERDEDNHPKRKPADIAQALKRSKMGYSKKPRVKPQRKKTR